MSISMYQCKVARVFDQDSQSIPAESQSLSSVQDYQGLCSRFSEYQYRISRSLFSQVLRAFLQDYHSISGGSQGLSSVQDSQGIIARFSVLV